MSASGTTLITKPDDGAMVDAYVDALLAMPLVPPTAAPASPVEAPSVATAAQAEPMPEEARQMDAEAANEADSTRLAEVEVEVEVETVAGIDITPEFESESEAEVEKGTDDLREPETETWPDEAQVFDDALAPADAAPAAAAPEPEPAWQSAQQAMPVARAPAPAAMLPPLAELDDDRLIQAAPAGQRWLRVAVGDDRYAVELLRVQEVVRLAPVIAVRGAVPSLLGVMNLRGRVVPVHDLGRWLRRMPVEPDERARIVVLEYQDELVGLLVTAVTDVVTLDTPQIEPPTPGLRDRIGMGIARTPGAPPTVLLDARVVFD